MYLARSPLAPTSPGSGVRPVALDYADKQIEEKVPLVGRERSKNAFVGSEILADQASTQFCPARCKTQLTRAAICAVHSAVDEAHTLKLIDNLTGVDRNDTDGFR